MRRSLLLIVLIALVGAAAVTTVTLAGDRSAERAPTPAAASPQDESAFARAAQQTEPSRPANRHRGRHRRVMRSLARRLDVQPRQLRAAVRAVMQEVRGRPFDEPDELAARKQELADGIAEALDRSPADVLAAVRAELSVKLEQGMRVGVVTEKGRDIVLGCFDRPGDCDLRALRWEIGLGSFHHHRR